MRKHPGLLVNFPDCPPTVAYSGNWRDIAPLLSWPNHPVRLFTTVQINRLGDTLYLDDEGLLTDPRYWIVRRRSGTLYAGKGLILGTDAEGNSTAPACELDWVLREFELARSIQVLAS